MSKYNIYYHFKPFIPRRLQIALRRRIVLRKRLSYKDIWPIDKEAGDPPKGFSGWPKQKKFALVLTHDVETAHGQDKCHQLIKLEEELGFCSSFNFVPERYNVSPDLRHYISNKGFEVGVHGLKHDGKLYKSKRVFQRRALKINNYLKEWQSVGFCSPSMHNKLVWMHELNIEYDTSTFDTDPFEPQPYGVGTIFPFFVCGNNGQRGYVEIPYTLPQDFTLFVLLKEKNIDIWKKKLDWIAGKGGMVRLITHPDYMNFRDSKMTGEEYPAEYYVELLKYINENYKGQYWHVLPRDFARFSRNKLNIINEGNLLKAHKNRYIENSSSLMKKIWVDLDNSPHVPFFKPIIRELKKQGLSVIVTARDCSQTCGLADHFNMSYKKIGRHFGKNKILKVLGLLVRSFEMIPFVIKEKPKLAVSHGSRAQILISKLFGIKLINIFDYEHTQGLIFLHPDYSLAPDVISPNQTERKKSHFLNYTGIKENVYVPEFKPDSGIYEELNIDRNKLVVTIRPPATQAHYHNPEAEELLMAVINYIRQEKNVCMVLMPRYKEQEDFIKETWPELCSNKKIIIPDQVVDGLNLMYHSDLVISGGGTMNREAAALGVPVYSIFRGKLGAVDRYLINKGKLTLLESEEDIATKIELLHRDKTNPTNFKKNETLNSIVNIIVAIFENKHSDRD